MAGQVRHTYRFNQPELALEDEHTVVQMQGCRTLGRVGEPLLPVGPAALLLPPGEEAVGVRVETARWVILPGAHDVAPAQREYPLSYTGPPDPIVRDENVYSLTVAHPREAWGELQTQYMCGHGVAFLALYPVRYVAASGEVLYCPEMEVVVETRPGVGSARAFRSLYRGLPVDREQVTRLVDNPGELGKYPDGGLRSTCDYVIITTQALAPACRALADYKEVTGFRTLIETVEDITAAYTGDDRQAEIRMFITDAYTQWGAKWVLLAGDDEFIPHRGFWDSGDYDIAADLYYAALDGSWDDDGDGIWGEPGEDDLLAEVYVGRGAIGDTAQASGFMNKQLVYQRAPVTDDCGTAIMLGEDLGWASWGKDYKEEIRLGSDNWGHTSAGIPPEISVQTLYDRDAVWSPMTDLLPRLNGGLNLVNHMGHAGNHYALKFYKNSINDWNCTNDGINHLHYIIYTQGCYCNSFDNRNSDSTYTSDAISEKWTTIRNGAVCFIGNTRYGFGDYYGTNGSSQAFDRQFFDAIFGEGITRIGEANQDSKHDLIPFISYNMHRWCYYQVCLLGEPTLDIWTGVPSSVVLSHNPAVVMGSPWFDVTADAGAGALAALSVGGELVGSAISNASGLARVYFDQTPVVAGTLDIWVTAHNRIPEHSTAQIVPADAHYVVYDSYQALDPLGDGDGVVEQGEPIDLKVALRNAGVATAPAVSAVLSSLSGWVSISDASELWGDIPAGGTQWSLDDYDVEVAGGVPDGHPVSFKLAVSSGDSLWNRAFTVSVSSPVLAYAGHAVDDAGGNGNGRLDPGETVDLMVTVLNQGGGDARSVAGVLSTSDPLVAVASTPSSYPDIPPSGSASASFEVCSDPAYPPGKTVVFQLDLGAEGPWSGTVTFPLVLGQPPVLFVDVDDEGTETRLTEALDASGWNYDTWRAYDQGSVPLDSLRLYQAIVWTAGDNIVSSMTDADRLNMSHYLDEGGALFLTAERYLSAYAGDPFTTGYLHVAGYTTNVVVDSVIGEAGDPIGDAVRVAADFPWDMINRPDEIVPDGSAAPVFRNGDGGGCVALRYPATAGDYRVVFMAVPFEALKPGAGGASEPEAILQRILCWLVNDDVPPTEVADLSLCLIPPDGLALSWSPSWDNTGVSCYRVYRASNAHFVPGPSNLLATVEQTSFTDMEVVGSPAANHYYVVTAVDTPGNESGPSDAVGEFDFDTGP
jgi:hypothetical protein